MSVTAESPVVEIKTAAEFNPDRPEPGVYRRVPEPIYRKAKAWNHSVLRVLAEQSPKHARRAYEDPEHKDPTDAMRLGTLAHMLLFEPERFANDVIGPPINTSKDPRTGQPRNTPYGSDTNAWREYQANHPGKIIATDDDVADAKRRVEAIREHEQLALVFGEASETELTLVWREKGVLLKARIDAYVPNIFAADLKTSESANPALWQKKVQNFSYHTQGAMYRRGVAACGMGDLPFIFGVVEGSPEYEAACVELHPLFYEIANAVLDEWIAAVARCEAENRWPGYERGIVTVAPDRWFIVKHTDGE